MIKNNWISIHFRKFILKAKRLNWFDLFLIIVSGIITYWVTTKINCFPPKSFNSKDIIITLITINGIFSAILMTHLFSRVAWTKSRKLELYNESIKLSQKVTNFRRIAKTLTDYYQVWQNDDFTKTLFDHNKYKHLDLYDLRRNILSEDRTNEYDLVHELYHDANFSEGISTAYLALVSLAKNRKADSYFQNDIYKDFDDNRRIYPLSIVERWLACELMSSIWYWLNNNNHYINYQALSSNHRKYILEAATKINSKYANYTLNDELIREIADDMGSHYLPELCSNIRDCEKGINGIDLSITILVFLSMIFGIFIPFVLLLTATEEIWYNCKVAIISSVNLWIISYFIMKFPFLITREVKIDIENNW